jgi:hypothetical protein
MGEACRTNERDGEHMEVIDGKPEGKEPLGIPRHEWVDNIKMDLGEIGRSVIDWIGLAEDRDQWKALAVMNAQVP